MYEESYKLEGAWTPADRRYTIHQDRRTEPVWRGHAYNVSTQEAEVEEPELELAWSMQLVSGQSTEIHSETLSPLKKKRL